ncbi:MAG: hypothetical protein A2020_14015 [Lentisphaerae bacterium GWF2_45_14]|nr:MAG: hypothetical protein A2020_14015 [Lentisphaerae bacterium GWF2_45_14]
MDTIAPLDLLPLEIGHQKVFDDYYRNFPGFYSCEYSFRTLYLWNDSYPVKWKIHSSRLLIYHAGTDFIMFPPGKPFTVQEFLKISDLFASRGYSGNYSFVPKKYVEDNPELKNHFYIKHNSGNADYVYSAEKLMTLSGRLSKKKNLIAQFERKNPAYLCRPLNSSELLYASGLSLEWENGNSRPLHPLSMETKAIRRAIEYFSELNLETLGIFSENKFEAYSIFSFFCNETYLVHFEKSNPEQKGAFQTINRETAKYLRSKCRFINREQDLGIPGLRKAKQSYHPDFMISTYMLIRKK